MNGSLICGDNFGVFLSSRSSHIQNQLDCVKLIGVGTKGMIQNLNPCALNSALFAGEKRAFKIVNIIHHCAHLGTVSFNIYLCIHTQRN